MSTLGATRQFLGVGAQHVEKPVPGLRKRRSSIVASFRAEGQRVRENDVSRERHVANKR